MDFAWAINALKQGQKVTRKALAGDPPIYLYKSTTPEGDSIIMKSNGTRSDFEWKPTGNDLLDADDWEEYVEPKEGIQLRSVTGETIKVTPGKIPVEEPDLDAETNKAIALVARNIAENLVELLQNPSVQRILQEQNKENNK